MGRAYKLYTNTTGSNNGVTSLRVVKTTKVRAINFNLAAVAGATPGSHFTVEVSKQNQSNISLNDSPEVTLASCSIGLNISNAGIAVNHMIPCDFQVDQGDTIYLNTTLLGATAPASTQLNVYLLT